MDNENVRKLLDKYMLDALIGILSEVDKTSMKLLPQLARIAYDHHMPVRDIADFIRSFIEFVQNAPDAPDTSPDTASLGELLANSGFLTIGFGQEGDNPDGNG